MRVGVAQVASVVGDLEGNVALLAAAAEKAAAEGAEVVVFPELAVTGYPPRDLLFDDGFVSAALDATADLARRLSGGPPAVVGSVARAARRPPRHPGLLDAALLLSAGAVRAVVGKRLLPAYDVFLEPRWFLPGVAAPPVDVAGARLGLLVCEDLWDEGHLVHPAGDLVGAGAGLLVCASASPFRRGVLAERVRLARRAGAPLVYVNAVGATDELVFDGRSFAVGPDGALLAMLPAFEEAVRVIEVPTSQPATASTPHAEPPIDAGSEEELAGALVLGIRDFARRNRLGRAFVGLSGGVDSALVFRLAVEALGAARVTAVHVPSRFTDPHGTDAARQLATSARAAFEVVPLEPLHEAAEDALAPLLGPGAPPEVGENLQARLRMAVLMAFVNRRGGFLLAASNKTELSLGYATLYGDMAGALAPIGDLTKPEVVALARHLGGFPEFVLSRPPTAELSSGQVDPFDYAVEAPRLEALVAAHRSDAALARSEHKRWQMGPILKVHETSFGTGRLVPISRR